MKKNYPFKVYLGNIKDTKERVYLEGFEWSCGWCWGGGYVTTKNMHAHFDGCFLDVIDDRGHPLGNFVSPWNKGRFPEKSIEVSNGCSIWESLDFFLDNAQYTENEWWRIKDLYKQFYIYRKAAEAFQYGGHCASSGRSPKEKDDFLRREVNKHIEEVIIPEIIKALKIEI